MSTSKDAIRDGMIVAMNNFESLEKKLIPQREMTANVLIWMVSDDTNSDKWFYF